MAISRIVEIAKFSDQYIKNLSANIVRVVEGNAKNVELNRVQMYNSTDSSDGPLIHKSTGSPYLSKAYAKKTGKKKPNLHLTGDFQKGMLITMPSMKEYFISSKDYKTKWIAENYGSIFGVSPVNQPKAQKSNGELLINDYKKAVFK